MRCEGALRNDIAGSQLFLGPWTHGGITNNPVGHREKASKSGFDQIGHILRFLEESLQGGSSASSIGKAAAPSGPHLASQAVGNESTSSGEVDSFSTSHLNNVKCNGSTSLSQNVLEGTLEAAVEMLSPPPPSAPTISIGSSTNDPGGLTPVLLSISMRNQLCKPCSRAHPQVVTAMICSLLVAALLWLPRLLASAGTTETLPRRFGRDERRFGPKDGPVRYFSMGHNAGWRTAASWPPTSGSVVPPLLYLTGPQL